MRSSEIYSAAYVMETNILKCLSRCGILKSPALDFSFETPTIQTQAVSEVIFYILFPKLTLIFFPPSMRYRQYFPSIGTLPRMCEETKILNSQVMRNPKQPISHIRTCILYLIGLPSTLGSLGNYS